MSAHLNQAVDVLARLASAGVEAQSLCADSREVLRGDVFVACPGLTVDGRRFIPHAVQAGAGAVLYETRDFEAPALPVPALGVPDLAHVAGHLAHLVYGQPSERLWMIGATGTNGKTSVTQWLAAAMNEIGRRCAVIGTLGSGFPGQLIDSLHTTPDALRLHRLLAQCLADGAQACAMEVSSIGLDQGRANGVAFDVGVFTNLTRDHLEYHGTMEAYGAAKARLFEVPGLQAAVLNLDDPFGVALARRLAGRQLAVIGYSTDPTAAERHAPLRVIAAHDLQMGGTGVRFRLHDGDGRAEVHAQVVGQFNVSNLLAVIGALLASDVPLEQAASVVADLAPPAGRMQTLGGVGEPLVVVDYAHTPDALEKVLCALRPTAAARRGRLICMFGCGGDRDPGKRPLMGEVAVRLADQVIITSDNPRREDPLAIIEAIGQGAGPSAARVADRAQAIGIALAGACANDVVLLAGKGHEPYQEVHGVRYPFSDAEQARAALEAWARAEGPRP